MRFHAKADLLRTLAPDVAVVTECARPEVLLRHEPRLGASGIAWAGRNPRKGLAVLSFGSWRVEPAAEAARDLGTVLPVRIEGGRGFRLVAAWSSPGPPPLRSAIEALAPFLATGPAILAGDFNRSLVRRRRDGSVVPSRLARRIAETGLESAYHAARGVPFGGEPEPTLFVHRGLSWRRHVDHCFLDSGTLRGLRGVSVGPAFPWTLASDHAPLVVEIGPEEAAP